MTTLWTLVLWVGVSGGSGSIDHIGPFTTDDECMQDLWLLKFGKDGEKIEGICIPVTTEEHHA